MYLESELLKIGFDFPDSRDEVPTAHDILEKIIAEHTNAIPHYAMLCHDKYSNAILCTISDDTSWRAEGIGESAYNNVRGTKAQDYPVSMAAKRAFDNAAIRYLKFPIRAFKKMYGDQEEQEQGGRTSQGYRRQPQGGQAQNRENGRNAQGSQSRYNGGSQTQERQKPPARQQGSGGLADEFNESPGQQPPRSTYQKQQRPKNAAQSSPGAQQDYTQTVVTVGRKAGLTVQQLAEQDYDSLIWVANDYPEKYPPRTQEKKDMIEACRRYIREYGNAA